LRELASQMGAKVTLQLDPQPGSILSLLQDWRSLFSVTGTPYTSLNRTLMNLPGGVPSALVCDLNKIQLQRPLTDRLEFLVALLATQHNNGRHQALFMAARREEILRALQRVAAHLRHELSPRRTKDVAFFVRFLSDYPEAHHGNIVGLAHKSIVWHQQEQGQRIANTLRTLGPDTPAALPPIALPERPQIRFLATVKDICEEGVMMDHCISTYAEKAIKGACFLFHVEHEGTMASVQVNAEGRVVQSRGPRNRKNLASQWGERILGQWGREL